jgi:putative MATE family efflux protein
MSILGIGRRAARITGQVPTLRQELTSLAWPSLVENVLQTMLGVVNMMMVGQMGPSSIAAVGVAQQIVFTLQVAYAGLSVGNTALVARSIGAKDPESARRIAKQSLALGAVVAAAITVIGFVFARELIGIMGAAPDMAELAVPYFRVVVSGSMFMMVMFIGNGTLRGAGDTRLPMLVTGIINLINIEVGYILIFGKLGLPALGVQGAAIANITAQAVGSAIVLYMLASGKSRIRISLRGGWRLDGGILKRLLNIGAPAAAEQIFMRLGMNVYSAMVISLGTLIYAAQNIIFTVVSFSFMPGFAFGIAATTMVGQSLGAKDVDRAEQSGWEATLLGIVWMSVMGFGFYVLAEPLIGLFTTDPRVIAYGAPCLRLIAWTQPLQAFGMVLAGGLRGAGDTRWTMLITAASIWLLRIPLAYFFGIYLGLGLVGVWMGNTLDMGIRGLAVTWRYCTGRWKSIRA